MVLFVASTVGTAMLVTDHGAVLHMIGGTVSSTCSRCTVGFRTSELVLVVGMDLDCNN
jgi:hypothetical protein